MKRFEEFIKDEYEFIYDNCENIEVLLDGFDNISDDMREKIEMNMFEKIVPKAMDKMVNNDYFWQTMHEEMDYYLIDAIKDYMVSLNFE